MNTKLSIEERIALIKSIAANGGELIGEDELQSILNSNEELFTYDGFEPSGQMHIAQGIIRAINTNKMIDAGFTFKMWVADWFGYLNNKMGGDLEKIKIVGKYFIEIWKASGMNLDGVEFLWTSDYVGKREYWELVMKVAKSATLKRVLRTTEIMGRSEADDLTAAQILYPCMQIADIFGVMKCQVTQLGLDQRKVNMLAREIGPELGFWKPVVLSQAMLQGLGTPKEQLVIVPFKLVKGGTDVLWENNRILIRDGKGRFEITSHGTDVTDFYATIFIKDKLRNVEDKVELTPRSVGETRSGVTITSVFVHGDDLMVTLSYDARDPKDRAIDMKMSKSKPDIAIFMTDSEEEVNRKIKNAYCPEGVVNDNPVLDYCKQIIFQAKYLKRDKPLLEDGKFVVSREEKYGGDVIYTNYEELEKDFVAKKLFPLDLKNAVTKYLNELLLPVRKHFEENEDAKNLLKTVQSFQVTR